MSFVNSLPLTMVANMAILSYCCILILYSHILVLTCAISISHYLTDKITNLSQREYKYAMVYKNIRMQKYKSGS